MGRRSMRVLASAAILVIPMAQAQSTGPLARVDVGGSYSALSGGYSSWQSLYVRASLPDGSGANYAEAVRRMAFDQSATLVSVGRVHDLNPDWMASGFFTVSEGGDFVPYSKWDVSVTRKLLPNRSLLVTGGLSRSVNHHGYRDEAVLASVTWFPIDPWMLEAGVRSNTSNPGSVSGERYWGVVGWRQAQQREITARFETGQEGWSVLGSQADVVGFRSQLYNLVWSEWLGEREGVKVTVEHYDNPYYRRNTLDLAVFKQF